MTDANLNAGGSFVISEQLKNHYAFRKSWLRRFVTATRNVILMKVDGDSMEPTIQAGDTVMIDRGKTRLQSGLIYAIGIDDTIIIKRLELLTGGRASIISDNRSEYTPYEAPLDQIRILGQVIWFGRQLIRAE